HTRFSRDWSSDVCSSDLADAKEQGLIDKLYVTGCLSHRYKDDLEREIPNVDAYFGTMELPLLLKKFKADYKHELVGERITTTSRSEERRVGKDRRCRRAP